MKSQDKGKRKAEKATDLRGKDRKRANTWQDVGKCAQLWAAAGEVKLGFVSTFVQLQEDDRVEFGDTIKILCSVHKNNVLICYCWHAQIIQMNNKRVGVFITADANSDPSCIKSDKQCSTTIAADWVLCGIRSLVTITNTVYSVAK